jgi:hypothetical protein
MVQLKVTLSVAFSASLQRRPKVLPLPESGCF